MDRDRESLMSVSPSNDSSAPGTLEMGPGSFRLGSLRKKDTALIGHTCTDEELRDRAASVAWNVMCKKMAVNLIPTHFLASFKQVVDAQIEIIEASKERHCSSYISNLWCCDKLAATMEDEISSFATRLRMKLVEERDNANLYVQPSCHNEVNTIRRFVEVSQHADKGKRPTMEDRMQYIPHISNLMSEPKVMWDERLDHPFLMSADEEKWVGATEVLAAVYDGHLGKEAAVYSKEHLHHHLLKSPHYPADVSQALRDAFITTSDSFLARAAATGNNSGTTATVAVVLGNKLTVGNVGDSSAVLYKTDGSCASVSGYHHIDNEEEVARLTAQGAEVMEIGGVRRINGQIRVTRTIGFKPSAKILTCEPEVYERELEREDEFLVMATDGLWDVMDAEEVGRVVRDAKREIDEEIKEAEGAPANKLICGAAVLAAVSACGDRFSKYVADKRAATHAVTAAVRERSASVGNFMQRGMAFTKNLTAVRGMRNHTEMDLPVPPVTLKHAFSHCYDSDSSFSDPYADEATDGDPDRPFMDYSIISEALINEALLAGTADNIAVTILFFNHPPPPEVPQEP